ncbi:MAG: ATP-binding protein [Lysobacterales bacterium]
MQKLDRKLLDLIGRVADMVLWDWDLVTNVFTYSDGFERLLGLAPDHSALSPDTLHKRVHPEDQQRLDDGFDTHFSSGTPLHVEYRLRHENGQYVAVVIRAECQRSDTGEVISSAGSIKDNSERVALGRELRESQAFMRLMMDINPDYIFVKDKNYVIVDANPAFMRIYPEDQRDKVIGFTTVEKYDPSEAAEFLAMDKKAFDEGFSQTTEKLAFPDGVTRVLETRKTRFIDRNGQPFILGSARDVSDRESMMETLTESNEELERFAYVCSHDLQEPLRMIKSFSGKLQHTLEPHIKEDEKARRYLDRVQDGASRAQQLIRDILSYSKVSNSIQRLQQVDLNKVVEVIALRLELESRRDSETLVADPLPTVTGNETQLFQLMGNLINNALKYYMEGRETRVRISAFEGESDWEITVADNGIGIQERFFERIFEVFRRLHRSDEYPGTGVGLALCRKIVEAHGGKIWVNSEPGAGSRFTFSLPKTTESRNH